MSKPTLDEIIDDFKSICCDAAIHRKGRCDYRCNKCDGDVSLELFYVLNALE